MSIIRVNKVNKYKSVLNEPFEDANISWQAKGILAYLFTRPDDWNVYISQLVNTSKNGHSSTSSAIQELIENGYLSCELSFKDDGSFDGYRYDVFEVPLRGKALIESLSKLPKNSAVRKKLEKSNPDVFRFSENVKHENGKPQTTNKGYKPIKDITNSNSCVVTISNKTKKGKERPAGTQSLFGDQFEPSEKNSIQIGSDQKEKNGGDSIGYTEEFESFWALWKSKSKRPSSEEPKRATFKNWKKLKVAKRKEAKEKVLAYFKEREKSGTFPHSAKRYLSDCIFEDVQITEKNNNQTNTKKMQEKKKNPEVKPLTVFTKNGQYTHVRRRSDDYEDKVMSSANMTECTELVKWHYTQFDADPMKGKSRLYDIFERNITNHQIVKKRNEHVLYTLFHDAMMYLAAQEINAKTKLTDPKKIEGFLKQYIADNQNLFNNIIKTELANEF